MYKQLYPRHDLKPVSRFCHKFGRVTIAGDLIGSDMPGQNSRSSSVIMAFWPSKGNTLNNIDNSQMQVGVVQFFMCHMLSYSNSGDLIERNTFLLMFFGNKCTHTLTGMVFLLLFVWTCLKVLALVVCYLFSE